MNLSGEIVWPTSELFAAKVDFGERSIAANRRDSVILESGVQLLHLVLAQHRFEQFEPLGTHESFISSSVRKSVNGIVHGEQPQDHIGYAPTVDFLFLVSPAPMTSVLDRIGNTPLVRLRRIDAGLPVPVLGKCEFLNPGGSGKDRIALAIVDQAERDGELRRGMTLVEATAGNTGIGLALVAAVRGYRLVCVMPEKMSLDKRTALAALGADVIVVPNAPPDDPRNFRREAERLAARHGWYLTRQFEHPANPAIHRATTGPEILAQAGGRIGAFVCGVGTGGTISGVGAFLKERCPQALVVLADPVGSRLAHSVDSRHPDLDSPYLVEGIGGSEIPAVMDLSVIDVAERVDDDESFAVAGRLLHEEGLLVGGSSGTAVAAALRIAARQELDGPVVALLADSWDRYFSQPWMRKFANNRQRPGGDPR